MSHKTDKIITGLGICSAISGIFLDQCADDADVRRIARNTQIAAEKAMALYPPMKAKDIFRTSRLMDERLAGYYGQKNEATVHTSLALSLIDEPLRCTRNRPRLMALQKVRAGLMALNDRLVELGCVEFESYQKADGIRERLEG